MSVLIPNKSKSTRHNEYLKFVLCLMATSLKRKWDSIKEHNENNEVTFKYKTLKFPIWLWYIDYEQSVICQDICTDIDEVDNIYVEWVDNNAICINICFKNKPTIYAKFDDDFEFEIFLNNIRVVFSNSDLPIKLFPNGCSQKTIYNTEDTITPPQ